MSVMGDNTTPSNVSWNDSFGNKQFWNAAPYTMPAGGGIANSLNCYMAGFGGSVTVQFMIWDNVGNIVYQTGNFTVNSTVNWKSAVTIAGTYIAAGSYLLGFWSSGHVQWVTESGSSPSVNGKSGVASPSTATGGSDEYGGAGWGRMGVYLDYTPGGVLRINTGTPGSPNWVVNPVTINTGTPGAPVWTNARWRVNTGTPGTPVWTDCS